MHKVHRLSRDNKIFGDEKFCSCICQWGNGTDCSKETREHLVNCWFKFLLVQGCFVGSSFCWFKVVGSSLWFKSKLINCMVQVYNSKLSNTAGRLEPRLKNFAGLLL